MRRTIAAMAVALAFTTGCWDESDKTSADSQCFTPCKSGLVADGEFRECPEDGLMEGCIGGAECMNGTCVAPKRESGGAPDDTEGSIGRMRLALESSGNGGSSGEITEDGRSCDENTDCPDFQICQEGYCHSNCNTDSECAASESCYRRVCRLECSSISEQGDCPDGEYCKTTDGTDGYCMPLTETTEIATQSLGAFEVSTTMLRFSNVADSQTFTVVNNSSKPARLEVRKKSHVEFTDEGPLEEVDMPLFWLDVVIPEANLLSQSATSDDEREQPSDAEPSDGESDSSSDAASDETAAEDIPDPYLQLMLLGADGGEVEITLAEASNENIPVWNGVIEIGNQELGYQTIDLSYVSRPEGQWVGTVYQFANFSDENLQAWVDARNTDQSQVLLEEVGNAIIWRWGAMRQGRITFENFSAAVQSMLKESWKWGTVRERCHEPMGACYLFDDPDGLESFTNNLSSRPIPSGLTELPIAMNLRQQPGGSDMVLQGKILTSDTMHYPGDPTIELNLSAGMTGCAEELNGTCLNYITDLEIGGVVGGRYYPESIGSECNLNQGFERVQIPWLVPGFVKGSYEDPQTENTYRVECRDARQPYDSPDMKEQNLAFAAANPIPDGRSRVRELSIIDGAIINQERIILFFVEESYPAVTDAETLNPTQVSNAYGLMVLERRSANLELDAYDGSEQKEERVMAEGLADVQCSDQIVMRALGLDFLPEDWTLGSIEPEDVDRLAWILVDGQDNQGDEPVTVVQTGEEVHYLCHETGAIDAGAGDNGSFNSVKDECPAGSGVTYFTFYGPSCPEQADLSALECQTEESLTCADMLNDWERTYTDPTICLFRKDPLWRCEDPDVTSCDNDLSDLRAGKIFFASGDSATKFVPLGASIDAAFRYKIEFRSRDGSKNIGFAPDICDPVLNAIPYCYDPPLIEELEERIDCALHVYMNYSDLLSNQTFASLREYLNVNFAVEGRIEQREGFETLYAELLIMLGDEAYTKAFSSRFDLAGLYEATFEGSQFEPGGIDLSGVAGQEMYSLYLAVQYYQLALDRLYRLMPTLEESLRRQIENSSQGFISQQTVTSYFDRLIRASSQKSRAWSEVAKKYESFNKPELARKVIERAYIGTYLESTMLVSLMSSIIDVVRTEEEAQIQKIIEDAQRLYKIALLDMRNVYKSIKDEVTYFGLTPDYIPFPALSGSTNAFEYLYGEAVSKASLAARKESEALSKSRSFDVDKAAFQKELVALGNSYDNQLSTLCGTFVGSDGNVYPATKKYAFHDDATKLLGDPCGYVGNGSIYEAMAAVMEAGIKIQRSIGAIEKKQKEIDIEQQRVEDVCGEIIESMIAKGVHGGIKLTLKKTKEGMAALKETLKGKLWEVKETASKIACVTGPMADSCATSAVATTTYLAGSTAVQIGMKITTAVSQIADFAEAGADLAHAEFEIHQRCDMARVNSDAKVSTMMLAFGGLAKDLQAAYRNLELAYSKLEKLRNNANRLQAQQEEMESMAIDVQAARNDPNVRIYKNSAVINADKAFDAAMLAAYKATKIYEYYTSQSYGKMDELFLIRMVSYGDHNLDNYLLELDANFGDFEELYGNPDSRVEIVSLRDNIWDIDQTNEGAEALSEEERIRLFHQRITDPELLDSNGYITIPFDTTVRQLSPLTRNHKIKYVEAEFVGSDVGDKVGRVYLRQLGTATVSSLEGGKVYYAFPQRTAVINTFFNGQRFRIFSDDTVFRNERLRDRPVANTMWELVINQRDEEVNKDINLLSLSDVVLYFYYTDFTEM